MNVAVIGTGYVGLTTGVTLAYLGHRVTCVDINVEKVTRLQQGISPIYEPGLEELMELSWSRLHFTADCGEAVMEADVVFIAVGTPAYADGSPNLTYLFASVEEMLPYLELKHTKTVLVNKSTAPVGTADQIQDMIRNAGLKSRVAVASNPEFLRQGQAVRDTLYPERIVVGGEEPAISMLGGLYSALVGQDFESPAGTPRPGGVTESAYIAVDRRSAELAKYAANAFLAMKISFINEIANVCDCVGADVTRIADIIGRDSRIGPAFLQAGIGYGGSCFPKDTGALQHIANTNGYDFKLMSAVIEVNNEQKYRMVEKARKELEGLRGKKVVVLGLTFKPGTDDMREAPSIPIIQALVEEGAAVYVHDPVALDKAKAHLPDTVYAVPHLEDALRDADAALLVTEWPEYKKLDTRLLRSLMARPLLIDGRNALDSGRRAELEYRGMGLRSQSDSLEPLRVNR
jgi:UDPglucose 6-dehydrogenase